MALPVPRQLAMPTPGDTAAAQAFPATSRYYGIPTATFVDGDGRAITYLTRRFCPQPDTIPVLARMALRTDERLDQFTARTLGDPTLFWRVADANNAVDPFRLTDEPGRTLTVPAPQLPGSNQGAGS
ncbi:MAG TPA: hypothetical protein VFQ39_05350 [Longimicrobium sp.]|nr:hypothetical protein [Longimicrobium sp.]